MDIEMAYQHGTGKAGAVKTAIEHAKITYAVFMDSDHGYNSPLSGGYGLHPGQRASIEKAYQKPDGRNGEFSLSTHL